MKKFYFKLIGILALVLGFYVWGLVTIQYKYFPYGLLQAIKQKVIVVNAVKKTNDTNTYWVNELRKGGYILYFRHSQRNNLDLIRGYDVVDIVAGGDIEGSTCLSRVGKADARLVGEIFKISDIPVGQVVSSPICRASEMARIAFGRVDRTEKALIYAQLVHSSNRKLHAIKLKNVLLAVAPLDNENTVVTAHTSTLEFYPDIFEPYDKTILSGGIDESGFYVLKVSGSSLELKYKFESLNDLVYGLKLVSVDQ